VDLCLPQSDVVTRQVPAANVVYEFRKAIDLRNIVQSHEVRPVRVLMFVVPDVLVTPFDQRRQILCKFLRCPEGILVTLAGTS
jgi:hypothetical protein